MVVSSYLFDTIETFVIVDPNNRKIELMKK